MAYDLVGAETLIGEDMDDFDEVDEILSGVDLIGARLPLGRRQLSAPVRARRGGLNPFKAAMQQAAAIKQANAGLIVREQVPTKARRLILPMASTGTVAAGASVTITSRPQTIAFKPQRIIIPSTVAPDFIITDIKVGNKSQFVQSGEISAESFVPNNGDPLEMDFDTVQTSQDFVMQIQNISGAARTFRATIVGRSAD